MQNYYPPDSLNSPRDVDAPNGEIGEDWSATLAEITARATQHKSALAQQTERTPDEFLSLLAKVVEGQVIPRLMLAHKIGATKSGNAEALEGRQERETDASVIEPFANLTLKGSLDDLEDFVVALTREGVSIQSIYLDLMAPSARLLGDYWLQDKCSFTDVTLGLGNLQTLMFRLSAKQVPQERLEKSMPKALFVTPEGAQHSFGVRMIGDLFRQAGWQTNLEISAPIDWIADIVKQESFDLLGISLSSSDQLAQIPDIIKKTRMMSMKRDIKILLGGSLVADDPSVVEPLGADMFACDGKEAIVIAQKLFYDHQIVS